MRTNCTEKKLMFLLTSMQLRSKLQQQVRISVSIRERPRINGVLWSLRPLCVL